MNGLSDSLTVGLVLALVFGALIFYLYTRIGQIEKRVSLTENILLDLKMATENTLMAMSSPSAHFVEHEVERVEPISAPEPIEKEAIEEVNEEDFYKNVLEQAQNKTSDIPVQHESIQGLKMDANYEAMTLKELKDEAKRRGVKVGANPHKKDVIDALKKQGQNQVSVLEPVPGSMGETVLEEGFPVELTK
jgi:hypothetical protein